MATKKKAVALTYSNLDYPVHAPHIKESMLAMKDSAMAESASNNQDRPIKLSVADDSTYEHLRVTFDYAEVVIFDTTKGMSAPRHNGALVSVLIEILGSPGNKVILNVENAVPAQLDCSITEGTTYSKTQILKTKW